MTRENHRRISSHQSPKNNYKAQRNTDINSAASQRAVNYSKVRVNNNDDVPPEKIQKKHQGKLDLHQLRKILLKIVEYSKIAQLQEKTQAELGKMFLYSVETLDQYKLLVADIKSNEQSYRSLPKRTEEDIAYANRFRKMPLTLDAAFDLLQSQKDMGIMFKSYVPTEETPRTLTQSSTVANKSYKEGKQKSKRKYTSNESKSDDEEEDENYCVLCDKSGHCPNNCRLLAKYALLLRRMEAEKREKEIAKKKTASKNTGNGGGDIQKQSTTVVTYASDVDDDEIFSTHSTMYNI